MAGQAGFRQALNDGSPHRRGRGLQAFYHVVEQVIENVSCIDRDLIQLRHNAVDTEGLIPQLSGFDDLIAETHIGLHRLRLRALEGQVLAGHIAVLTVRGGHLIPAGCGFVEHNNLAALFILAENLVIRARTGTQMQRPTFRGDFIDLHVVGAGLVLLCHQIDAGGLGGRHRCTKNAVLRKPRPFAALVDVVHQRKLPLAVQRFGYGAAHGRNRTEAVIGKVGAVGGIYTDQEKSPPSGHKESAQPVGGRSKDKLEVVYALCLLTANIEKMICVA